MADPTSTVERTQACLSRIAAVDANVHAYRQVHAQRALSRAAAVDRGEVTGPLAGMLLAVKDNLCMSHGQTTCGSKMLEHFSAPYTATAVARLEAAGAVVLGKTNLDEFAMGSSTENSAFDQTANPWDVNRVPGGSSGGSAAAVAADLCDAAIGSDTGGSIRQPAAYCGISGLKPTYGRISRWGLVAFASSLDQIGPMAWKVQDLAALLQVMAGADPLDSTSAPQPVPDYMAALDQPLGPFRIGLAKQYLSDANDPAMAAAVQNVIDLFTRQGASIVEVDLPHTRYGIPCYYVVATAEASSNLARYDGIHYGHRSTQASDLVDLYARSRAEGFGEEVKRRIMLGTYALSSGYYDAYYLRALKVRRLIKGDFDRAFTQCDAILCPTTTGPAFRRGENVDDPLAMYLNDIYTVNANLAGIPGLSLPAGFTSPGSGGGGGGTGQAPCRLPLGLQLLGPMFSEARLLAIGAMFQRETDYHMQRPAAQ